LEKGYYIQECKVINCRSITNLSTQAIYLSLVFSCYSKLHGQSIILIDNQAKMRFQLIG